MTISEMDLGERFGRLENQIKNLTDIVTGRVADHETRLRELETFKTKALGVGVAMVALWAVVEVAVTIAMKCL